MRQPQQRQIIDGGGSAVLELFDVMSLGPGRWDVASGERTSLIARGQRQAFTGFCDAMSGAVGRDRVGFGEDGRDELGVGTDRQRLLDGHDRSVAGGDQPGPGPQFGFGDGEQDRRVHPAGGREPAGA